MNEMPLRFALSLLVVSTECQAARKRETSWCRVRDCLPAKFEDRTDLIVPLCCVCDAATGEMWGIGFRRCFRAATARRFLLSALAVHYFRSRPYYTDSRKPAADGGGVDYLRRLA
jgi:hypothetical protein